MNCPEDRDVQAYVERQLPDDSAAALEAHVDACASCRQLVALLATADEASAAAPSLQATDSTPAVGARVGRYVVVGRLGEGGMGVVLSAYDPELDRGVALKLVRPDAWGPAPEDAQARLVAEARAMARLSHPNVAAIHDVGTVGDQVFLAMERIDGPTLRLWLDDSRRDWRTVRDLFLQAGAGLAAAHAAGIVHRDFKLDNVIVGSDGRARVTDFGLARPAFAGTGAAELSTSELSDARSDDKLTRTGAVLGTPAYMAPEVRHGAAADARSDQYSFCVALHEALFGYRPGASKDGAASRPVPRWLAAVLQRGLADEPTRRFDGMRALLDALLRDRRVRRARLSVAVTLALLLPALLFAGISVWRGRQGLCSGAGERLVGVWDTQSAARVGEAFTALGDPVATAASVRLIASLDSYAERWRAQYTEACVATRVRGERSDDLMDRQMSCLESRRRALGELVGLFATVDAKLALRATRAVAELPSVDPCGRIDLLEARLPRPRDGAARAHLDEAEALVASASALRIAGRDPEAMPLALQAVDQAARSTWAPIEARALLLLGRIETKMGEYERAEQTLYEGLWAAQRGGDHLLVADAWINLLWVEAYHRGNYDSADRLASHAEAALARAGGDTLMTAQLAEHLGTVRWRQARYAEAAEHHQAALNARIAALGEEHEAVSRSLMNLGIVRRGQGRNAEAAELHRRALEISLRALGPDHPTMGRAWTNLGTALYAAGKVDEALLAHRESKRILATRYGDGHPFVAIALNNIGTELMDLGQLDEAQASFERALEINLAELGDEHTRVGTPLANLGDLALRRNDAEAAVAWYTRALTVWQAALGLEHPRVAIALTGLGRGHLAAGAPQRALPHLQRAWTIVAASEADDNERAETAFALAQARAATGAGRAEARALATEARELFRKGLPADANRLAAVDAWLAK